MRGYKDPPSELFRYDGKPAIGLAVGMRKGANIVDFGEELTAVMSRRQGRAADRHRRSTRSPTSPEWWTRPSATSCARWLEAVVIVLVVSFVSLGLRAGLVVTLTIPLVLAITFVVMDYAGFTLQRISLGALIIALGLLVDDAMIAIETMISPAGEGRRA